MFNSPSEDNGGATLQNNAELDHLRNEFGEERLIYGSNWPVSDRGAPYEVVFALVQEYFAGKGEGAMEKYFWKNALVAYGVK